MAKEPRASGPVNRATLQTIYACEDSDDKLWSVKTRDAVGEVSKSRLCTYGLRDVAMRLKVWYAESVSVLGTGSFDSARYEKTGAEEKLCPE